MHSGGPFPPQGDTRRLGPGHHWYGALVGALDHHLRRRQGIVEYTDCPDCIFRMQVIPCGQDVTLRDGTRLSPHHRVVELHFWNEQLPVVSDTGSPLAWARQMSACAEISMRELARHLASRPDLDDIRAIRGNMSLGPAERSGQIARLVGRYGFEQISSPGPPRVAERMHRLGENILISMLVIAHNAAALRTDTLRRDRVMVYLSRKKLDRLYGLGPRPPPS